MKFNIQNSLTDSLPADPDRNNTRRQVTEACYSYVTPRVPSNPSLVHVSKEMLSLIGLAEKDLLDPSFLSTFSGATVLENTTPYAMCYGGHQFGHWAGQLGDGRAINLTEIIHQDKRWALQLKGAGATPYSRTADGLAVLRSSIREHLCSEAMHHLGVPTTRSLSLAITGDQVLRDVMYDGNPAYEIGAVVCRVSPSFLRFGNFQIFAARQDLKNLKLLTDYTIKTFFPEIKKTDQQAYIDFFSTVSKRTREMVLQWQRVGFVHGVMNTDNMSILGLTIDYGPYGWLENYDADWTPNTTDAQGKRYRFSNQPRVALWNLMQLANALVLLIEDPKPLEEILDQYKKEYTLSHQAMMRDKLGFASQEEGDELLVRELEAILQLTETDMTIFFRNLADCSIQEIHSTKVATPNLDFFGPTLKAFYKTDELTDATLESWQEWFTKYYARLKLEKQDHEQRKQKMNLVNPKYVLRNYMAQLAIDQAEKKDYSLIEEFYQLLKAPYDEQVQHEKWFAKRPEWARHKVGCSMLSCSS